MRMCLEFTIILSMLICGIFSSDKAFAEDVVYMSRPSSDTDLRRDYHYALIEKILKATESDYGHYRIVVNAASCSRKREMHQLIDGKYINVSMVPATQEWEDKVLPIRIPILKGILGYKLFLVKKDKLYLFKKNINMDSLKAMKAGLGSQWTTAKIMTDAGFHAVTTSNYECLFKMLLAERFDYFPRGVNEIYGELEARPFLADEVVVEPTRAMYFPSPVYIFVSPKSPDLAKRIEEGFKRIIADKSFDKLFLKLQKQNLCRANLKSRAIFKMKNPLLTSQTPLNNKTMWFDPLNNELQCN